MTVASRGDDKIEQWIARIIHNVSEEFFAETFPIININFIGGTAVEL